MTKVLERAGAAFMRAFGASVLVLTTGVLAAPNLDQAQALGVAAFISSVSAGLRAVQVFVPQLSWGKLLGEVAGAYADAFTRAFVGAFLTLATGVLQAPDLHAARALGAAALVGALGAGARALQGLATRGEWPKPQAGVVVPAPSA